MNLKGLIITISESNSLLCNGHVNKSILVTMIITTSILFAIFFYSKFSDKWTKAIDPRLKKQKKSKPNIILESEIPNIKSHEIEIENRSDKKSIGYVPINIFLQQEPVSYPYVLMPDFNCSIELPLEGRNSLRGFKEDNFLNSIVKYFGTNFQILDSHSVKQLNESRPYEPDIILIDEKDDLNLYIDIEIDEPYEGTNEISERKATHYQYFDTVRNSTFTNFGWIVIRFAEIQVHQAPVSCCLFIAEVIASINPKYEIPQNLKTSIFPIPIKQWTKEEAEQLSNENYREKYLGIPSFGNDPYVSSKTISERSFDEILLGVNIHFPQRGKFIGLVSSCSEVIEPIFENDVKIRQGLNLLSIFFFSCSKKITIGDHLLKPIYGLDKEEIKDKPVEVEFDICIKGQTKYKDSMGEIKTHTRTSNRAIHLRVLSNTEYEEYKKYHKRLGDIKLLQELEKENPEYKNILESYLSSKN
jgi:hypothetical protein